MKQTPDSRAGEARFWSCGANIDSPPERVGASCPDTSAVNADSSHLRGHKSLLHTSYIWKKTRRYLYCFLMAYAQNHETNRSLNNKNPEYCLYLDGGAVYSRSEKLSRARRHLSRLHLARMTTRLLLGRLLVRGTKEHATGQRADHCEKRAAAHAGHGADMFSQ